MFSVFLPLKKGSQRQVWITEKNLVIIDDCVLNNDDTIIAGQKWFSLAPF